MNWKGLAVAMLVAFSINGSSHAVDTTRYALITPTAKMEAPPLPALKLPITAKSPYPRIPVRIAPGVASEDANLMDWTPMSIEAFGYDIREVWRQNETPLTFWLGVGPR